VNFERMLRGKIFNIRRRNYSTSTYSKLLNRNGSAVIVGASGGIGNEFTRKLLENTNMTIIGTSRDPNNDSLLKLKDQYKDRFMPLTLDISDSQSRTEAIQQIKEMKETNIRPIDFVFICSGIVKDPDFPQIPERTFNDVDEKWMQKSYNTNVIGPTIFIKEMMPLLLQERKPQNPAVVITMSAKAGSITENIGGWYSLRMSKVGLNMMMKTVSIEFKRRGVWFLSLCPGHVKTPLTESFPFKDKVDPEGRVLDLLRVLDDMTDSQTGGFYDWTGKNIPF